MNFIGEIAGVVTAFCWAATSTFFTIGGRYVGSVVVNRTRLVAAVVFLSTAHLVLYGSLVPVNAAPEQWMWLGLSGVIGLVLGDACLFQAFVLVGNHLAMLLMSLVPIISTLIAWIFLHESPSFVKIIAILLTVFGIIMVVLGKNTSKDIESRKRYMLGILLGLGGALGQAIGLVFAKKGLINDLPGLSATLIRVLVATVLLWIITFASGKARETIRKLSNKKATLAIIAGAFMGPFLGIWMSMVAIKYTYIGVASTLMALTPIMLIPVSHWIFKEKITVLTIAGTLIAVAGTALIFLT
ncbi:DMT family transporter [bacterium]|nr:DMT family transporter [bacterium]